MIRSLTIRNIALIENISVCFQDGFTVLSGETGAGKSIIVDAVTLMLGGRADKNLIRTGCEKASVEAEFEYNPLCGAEEILAREGIETAGNSAVIYREISQNGRNVCRINGVMVPLSVLRDTAALLLNLHGQSEHQFLADEDKHLAYLDLIGDSETHQKLKRKVSSAYENFIENHRAYAKLVKMNNVKERREDQLKNELKELHSAGIKPGEEARLLEESKKMNKAARIHEKLQRACRLLGNGGEGEDALHSLQTAGKDLMSLSAEDPVFETLAGQCENLYYSLEEILYSLNTLNQTYAFSDDALENTENRLEFIRKLARKYGPSEEDILKSMSEMEAEYKMLADLDRQLEKKGLEHKKLLSQYRAAARELTEERKRIAGDFENRMMYELKDLGMENTEIKVEFLENQNGKPLMPSPEGDDRIRFMISPNPGEPLKPMSKIASGGELSRLMLAVKTIESGRSGFQTMVFDEIDTGISGRMAQAVAEKMTAISRRQQVICISHLPQIAAAADHQYLVFKGVKEGRTFTEVKVLGPEERSEEIARMISGAQGISGDAVRYAEEMIRASAVSKKTQK